MKFVVVIALLLAGCGARPTVVETRVQQVLVEVPVPCAAARPATPVPLRDRYSDEAWQALDARQRAAAVGRQGLARLKHAEDLHAATAACPELESK